MKLILPFIVFTTLIVSISTSCRSYKEITKKPERLENNFEVPSFESSLILALKVDLSTLENQINEAFKKGYQGGNEGTYEYKSWIKTKDPLYNPDEIILTKDPLYNPRKWLKTKDPLYNPKKWIKAGPLKTKNPLYHPNKWIQTKDPSYHPNEWIKTNNPLYHPNEWIETKGPSVAVGYRYDFALELKERIRLSYVDDHTLRVKAPISFKGSAGFQGSIPASLTLDKKNFDGAIEFLINTRVAMRPDWCPQIDAVVTHSWISNPQIEIMDNIYISITGVTDKLLNEIEKNVNSIIRNQIKCETFKDLVKDKWKYYGFPLPPINGKQYYLNINPTSASLSSLKFCNDSLALFIGVTGIFSVNDKPINTTVTLPQLEEQTASSSQVKLYLPLQLKYDDIKNAVNNYLKDNDVTLKPDLILNQKAKIKLREMDIYPNGDEVVIGVNIKANLPGSILPVKGWIYLLGKPTMVGNKMFQLDSIDFSMTVDNKFYPVISSIFKQQLVNVIKKHTTRDISDSVESVKKMLLGKINSYQHERIRFTIQDLDFGIYDIILTKDEIAIIAELSSIFDVFIKK